MKTIGLILLMLLGHPTLDAQTKNQTPDLAKPTGTIGSIPTQKKSDVEELASPTHTVGADLSEFDKGKLTEEATTFEYRISRLETDMHSVLSDISFGKGAFWLLSGAILVAFAVLKFWWKPIVRFLVKDSYQSSV